MSPRVLKPRQCGSFARSRASYRAHWTHFAHHEATPPLAQAVVPMTMQEARSTCNLVKLVRDSQPHLKVGRQLAIWPELERSLAVHVSWS